MEHSERSSISVSVNECQSSRVRVVVGKAAPSRRASGFQKPPCQQSLHESFNRALPEKRKADDRAEASYYDDDSGNEEEDEEEQFEEGEY